MDEDSFEKSSLTSDFNEAKFQIMRLGILWEKFNSAMLSGNFLGHDGANWISDRIYGELSRDAERIEKSKKNDGYSRKIDRINKLIIENRHSNKKLYFIIKKKEQVLRRLQDESGKGSRYSYSDEDMM